MQRLEELQHRVAVVRAIGCECVARMPFGFCSTTTKVSPLEAGQLGPRASACATSVEDSGFGSVRGFGPPKSSAFAGSALAERRAVGANVRF